MTYQAHPMRIQRKRTKGWRMPEGSVYVGRPTIFGNPWTLEKTLASGLFKPECCREVCVYEYRGWLTYSRSPHSEHCGIYFELREQREKILAAIPSLRGKLLACFCPLDRPCHADVLAELANQ